MKEKEYNQTLFEKWIQEYPIEKDAITEFEKEFLETFDEKRKELMEFHTKVEKAIKDLKDASSRLQIPVTIKFNGITFEYEPKESRDFQKKTRRVREFLLDQGEDDAVFYKIDDAGWSNSYAD